MKILVADDDLLLAELLRHKLNQHGYQVTHVADGQAAVETAERDRPDLIVLDIMMPKLSGIEVLRQLMYMTETRDIPVIMLTARRKEQDVLQALQLGVEEYLVKPFSPDELLARLRKVLTTARVKGPDADRATGTG
jgi:DNA-binding response OmpR family regulator